MAQKTAIPKGTRDFNPTEMGRRNYIFDEIKTVYRLYGFEPIETPSMELLSTLLGKYGEEGDKLLFRILNSGDFLKDVSQDDFAAKDLTKISGLMCERGLRYDLTVPFARYVVQHRNEIVFPFKRYQIQPVWRADRPQKGRYREFYQCDADVIGSDSLINEAEFVMIMDTLFSNLGIRTNIKINNRKILSGMVSLINRDEMLTEITTGIDKLDKIGIDGVRNELIEKGMTDSEFEKIKPLLTLSGDNRNKIEVMRNTFKSISEGQKGIDEIEEVLNLLSSYNFNNRFEFDLSLARGLNYYTGSIFEVKAVDVEIGSLCGGGRYDDLTGIFGLEGVSGVGISFGADRIYDVLEALNLFPESVSHSVKAMFVNFGNNEAQYCLQKATQIRQSGIAVEVYPESAKMKKQMSYADSKKIPFVIFVGENEMQNNLFTIKNMISGEQKTVNFDNIIEILKQN
ncbi:MAG TPA: histidine--tRNA ligase [Salinivirgaceae bacterium]|nr:histidine--tRNA ligase [Salinivirgaceae bacterium]